MDLDNPRSSAGGAAGEEPHKMEDKLDLEFDSRGSASGQGIETQSSLPKDEPRHASAPLPAPRPTLQANAGDIPETVGWGEGEDTLEKDSSDSGVYTPTDSGGSSWTPGDERSDVESPGMEGGLERLFLEDTEGETSNSDTSSFVEVSGANLPWLHMNVRRILRRLLQQWPGRTATHHHPETQSSISTQQGLESQQQRDLDRGKKRRKQAASNDDLDQGDPSAGRSKHAKRRKGPGPSRPFACPFCKKDLQRHRECTKYRLTRVSRVKQHIHRIHDDEIGPGMREGLQERSAPGTEEDQWYEIFGLLFPLSPRPASPYNDFTVSERPQASHEGVLIDEALYIPHTLLTEQFVEAFHRRLAEDPELANVRLERIREALNLAWADILDGVSQQVDPIDTLQARAQGDNTDSGQSFNNHGSGRGRDLSTANSSNDHEVPSERQRSTTIRMDGTPDTAGSWHEPAQTTGWEEPPQDFELFDYGSFQDENLNLDGQLGLGDGVGLDPSSMEDQMAPVSESDHHFDVQSLLHPPVEGGRPATDGDWWFREGSGTQLLDGLDDTFVSFDTGGTGGTAEFF
ncbi:hypothetical protein ACHAPT_010396 [Fusarium lateritium]